MVDSDARRGDSVSGGAEPDSSLLIPGLTVQRQPLDFTMQAGLMGTLEIDASTNCLVVRILVGGGAGSSETPVDVDVAWPLGWSVAIRNGEIALVDADGQTTRTLGDEVWLEGGSIDAVRANVVSCTGRKEIFVASGRFSGP